ncbi:MULTISPECIES: hypothetical protein [unclassified Microcoleus]|uniref:hypothetical protein n=1 Tax=unclassified Microcoleus TaxID=2642155 RepID=UPI002FD70438
MSTYKVYGRNRATETSSRSPVSEALEEDREKFPIKLSQDRGLRIRKQYNGGYFDSSAIIKNLKAAGMEACI